MLTSYRKKIVSPLMLYNIYIQTYNRYFHNFYTHVRKRELENKKIEEYFIHFSEFHYIKLDDNVDKLKKYILWLFSKYGKVPIFSLHAYINEYLKDCKKELSSFYYIIVKYITDNKISDWNSYIKGSDYNYPKILEHYISKKEFPFEFILYLKIFDSLNPKQRKIMKVLLRNEFVNLDERLRIIDDHKDFFDYELEQILTILRGQDGI